MSKRVVLAMSGGVDSSVAAALLKEQGYDVLGLFMRTGPTAVDEERRAKTCCSVADALDARNVADRLDIPFYVLDFERDFARIKDYFADEYLAGRTPNPCVMCNIWLKFGKLWAYGKQVGADFVATGHYARIGRAADGTPRVARAVDRAKDQSYVLFGLRRGAAAARPVPGRRVPQGGDPRDGPRARPAGPRQAGQPGDLLRARRRLPGVRPRPPSRARDPRARSSTSRGTSWASTPASRRSRSASAAGWASRSASPRYVVQIEPIGRTVTVGRRESLEKIGLIASRFNWQGPEPAGPVACLAQIRAQHRAVPATVEAAAGRRRSRPLRDPAARHHSRPGRHRLSGRPGAGRRLDLGIALKVRGE